MTVPTTAKKTEPTILTIERSSTALGTVNLVRSRHIDELMTVMSLNFDMRTGYNSSGPVLILQLFLIAIKTMQGPANFTDFFESLLEILQTVYVVPINHLTNLQTVLEIVIEVGGPCIFLIS